MKRPFQMLEALFLVLLVLLLAGCKEQSGQPEVASTIEPINGTQDMELEVQQARAAIGAFATALKSELTSAMQNGGPLNAIDICNTRAIAIRQQVSHDQGLQLSRVSLRNRNPGNAPLDWQRPVLESFDQQLAAGADPNGLDWSEIVTSDNGRQFRYMKAIPTGGMCLLCHGQNIAPEVSEAITTLYPEDQATGFSEGEIRGAFVVVKNL